ncbi:MAG: proline--tRNA ligase [Anaerolineales bacterium]|nr:proline--tRNA ligase [Anaerolineales bacterium]
MRYSQHFGTTLHEDPSGADTAGCRLLLRAGYMRPLAAGIFSLLPLGLRVKNRIERILREEMEAIGGQELLMPVVQPAEIWKRSGRWGQIGAEMGRMRDRTGRDLALAMTHEEAVSALAATEVRSYRDLPRLVYHIQTKWRDDPRPRAGLIRVREFTMLDSYSLDSSAEGMEIQYRAHLEAYERIFRRCGLPAVAVGSDSGMMGGKTAHEFMYLSEIGEDTILLCTSCEYRANRQAARFRKPAAAEETPLPVEKVATPGITSIEDLTAFLKIPPARTAKAVFFVAYLAEAEEISDRLVFAVIRGDLEVNETKLANAVRAVDLRPARDEEIRATGAVPGYASPIGVRGAFVVADDSIAASANLIAGANEEGFHLRNVNCGREYLPDATADIAAARDGDACPACGAPMRASRGVEVGNIFQLGTRYSEPMGCGFLDREGNRRPVWMGSYGIGVGRLMACIAEEYRDEAGLIWPPAVAPFAVALVGLGCTEESERAYRILRAASIDVFYDDRSERAGVKFADADLMGFPLRVTVSERSLREGGVEFKPRGAPEKRIIPWDSLPGEAARALERMGKKPAGPQP